MNHGRRILWTRVAFIAGLVGLLEALCRLHVIKPLTMIAPSQMVQELIALAWSGELAEPALQTFIEVGASFLFSVTVGGALGAVVHALPRVRRTLDPLLASWYAVPFFVFYPLLVALLGLNVLPLIAIGVVFATPAMMLSTLAGLDRVPRVMHKVARVHRLSQLQEVRLITLPSAAPHLFTGLKLSFAYSFIGIIAGEFILSGGGLGYGISYAYESFETPKMYALMLFVLLIALVANGVLHVWDRRLARRRGLA
ncbi:MAG: ABC transporter permease subunit [Proteobacteria bacterium]|nr:ABC transporter permease subunit [Pseudomonadota bacterium]